MIPKGALTVFPMQSGAVKGNTQGTSQDSSCCVFQGSAQGASQDSNRKFLWWQKQVGSTRGAAQRQWILKTSEFCHSVSPVGVSQADDSNETSESCLGSCSVSKLEEFWRRNLVLLEMSVQFLCEFVLCLFCCAWHIVEQCLINSHQSGWVGWLRKFLQWEKHKQGELEVLPKRVLTCFQSMPDECDRSRSLL